MKKVILTLGLIGGISLASSAQCKTKKDPFTGEPTITTGVIKLGKAGIFSPFSSNFDQSKGETHFNFYVRMSGERNEIIGDGTDFLVKLEGGEVMTLKTVGDAAPTSQVRATSTSASVYSVYFLKFNLSDNELSELSSRPVDVMKFIMNDKEEYPVPVLKGAKKKIMKAAKCLSN